MNRKTTTALIILILSGVMVLHTDVKGQSVNPNALQIIGLKPAFVAEKVAEINITTGGSKWLTLRDDSQIKPQPGGLTGAPAEEDRGVDPLYDRDAEGE